MLAKYKNDLISDAFDLRCFMAAVFSASGVKFFAFIFLLILLLAVLFSVTFFSGTYRVEAASRLKDIVSVQGIRDNILIGYGLVVGLNGTGDKLNNSVFTAKSLHSFMDKLGINVGEDGLNVKNVAAVTVTSTLPPFARVGSRIDVSISALGDAGSLQGGTLIVTPLMGADGEIYAVAQGAISIGGFSAKGDTATISKGTPTSGFISSGAIIEKEIDFDLNSLENLNLALVNPDLVTARRVAEAINDHFKSEDTAYVKDPGTIVLKVADEYNDRVAYLLSEIEHLEIEPDHKATIIIDEASGTIVMNENVRVNTVAVAQGNLVVTVREDTVVSQPGALAPESAGTVAVGATSVAVNESGGKIAMMGGGTSLSQLITGLNALGIGPRDLISILQNIKAAGALQAEIETR